MFISSSGFGETQNRPPEKRALRLVFQILCDLFLPFFVGFGINSCVRRVCRLPPADRAGRGLCVPKLRTGFDWVVVLLLDSTGLLSSLSQLLV